MLLLQATKCLLSIYNLNALTLFADLKRLTFLGNHPSLTNYSRNTTCNKMNFGNYEKVHCSQTERDFKNRDWNQLET